MKFSNERRADLICSATVFINTHRKDLSWLYIKALIGMVSTEDRATLDALHELRRSI